MRDVNCVPPNIGLSEYPIDEFTESSNDRHRSMRTVISSGTGGSIVHQINHPIVHNKNSIIRRWSLMSSSDCTLPSSLSMDYQMDVRHYDFEEFQDPTMDDVYQADSDGDLLLHIAVAKENELHVAQLIHMMTLSNRSLDVYNKMKQTPLHVAVMTGHLDIVRRLLSTAGCSPLLPDRRGNNAVHLAVRSSSLACVNMLLNECSSSVLALHQLNYDGFTPLHLAVFRRDINLVELLVAKGADCNAMDGTSGRTALYHSIVDGDEDVVHKLIALGASVNVANYAGVTPLVVATDKRLKTITSLLISRGATISSRDDSCTYTTLHQ